MGVYEAFRIQPDLKIPQPVCKIFPINLQRATTLGTPLLGLTRIDIPVRSKVERYAGNSGSGAGEHSDLSADKNVRAPEQGR